MTRSTPPEPTAANLEAAKVLRQKANDERRAKEDSFDRCDTDGFLSQWAHGICAQRDDLQAIVTENGGCSTFPALFDLQGNLVAAKLVTCTNRWSHGTEQVWAVLANDKPDSQVTAWIKAFPARISTMERKGYREGTVWTKAKADIIGQKTAYAAIVRIDGGFSRDVLILEDGMPEAQVAA